MIFITELKLLSLCQSVVVTPMKWWPCEVEAELIKSYKKRPELWNAKHPTYSNKQIRTKKSKEVAKISANSFNLAQQQIFFQNNNNNKSPIDHWNFALNFEGSIVYEELFRRTSGAWVRTRELKVLSNLSHKVRRILYDTQSSMKKVIMWTMWTLKHVITKISTPKFRQTFSVDVRKRNLVTILS